MSELVAMSIEDLQKLVEDTQKELFHARAKVRAGELKNVSAIRPLKLAIAKILTVMKQKRKMTKS